MGYALCMGTCLICKHTFTFNPVKVPSLRIDGTKEPICKSCIERANKEKVAKGIEPFIIPDDAYTACNEAELG